MASKYCQRCGNYKNGFMNNYDGTISEYWYCAFFEKSFDELNEQRTEYEISRNVNYYDLSECVGHTDPCGNCGKPDDGDCFRDCPQLDGGF